MKVLFAAYRNDPRDPQFSSGAEYNFYQALQRCGLDLQIVGPYPTKLLLLERMVKILYERLNRRAYLKYDFGTVWRASQDLNRAVDLTKPDVIFTLFPAALVFYNKRVPCVYRVDTTFRGIDQDWPEHLYGGISLGISIWQEQRAYRHSTKIITHSLWSHKILTETYKIDADRVEMFPNPSAIPEDTVPKTFDARRDKPLQLPLKLLFVGRNTHLKGIDIALETVKKLNEAGVAAELLVCGMCTTDFHLPYVKSMGIFRKNDPHELHLYTSLYRQAHLLIHPTRFDASPTVTSEAAAFGVPTITNEIGGVATSVLHNISGIVLPRRSSPELYVMAVLNLFNDSERYYQLCESTRKRYEIELNWTATAQRVLAVLKAAVSTSPRHS